jgi:HAD superfamily hydrolase (TIGR01493 family)
MKPPINCVAFDVFGTLFDISSIPKQEIRDYIAHIRNPHWSPLTLPESWRDLPLFPDTAEGLAKIKKLGIYTATCSNAPWEFTDDMIHRAGIWELLDVCDIARNQCFKPHPDAYKSICQQLDYMPAECLMVTGNAKSPDIEGARAIGMQSISIRQPDTPQTILELANLLEKL